MLIHKQGECESMCGIDNILPLKGGNKYKKKKDMFPLMSLL